MKSLFAILIIVFAVFHGSVLIYERSVYRSNTNGVDFEDYKSITGDYSYYRNAILSLLEFDIAQRINRFPSPRLPMKHQIPENSFSFLERVYATFYPYPPLKVGFAWTGALFSWFIPKSFFQNSIPRIFFVNLVLSFLCIPLLYFIVLRLSGSTMCFFFVALLHLTDVTLLHSNYHSQSYVTGGLFWLLLSICLSLQVLDKKGCPPILVGLALGISLQTSPNILPWSAGLMVAFLFLRKLNLFLWSLAGVLIPFLYLTSVDGMLELAAKEVPGYLDHLVHTMNFDGVAVNDIPYFHRWMWDLRAIQPFIVPMILATLLALYRIRNKLPRPSELLIREEVRVFSLILLTGAFLSFFIGLPMVRTIVPFCTLLVIFWGIALGTVWGSGNFSLRVVCLGLVSIWAGNSLYSFDWISKSVTKPSQNILLLEDYEASRLNQAAYFRHLQSGDPHRFIPPHPYKYVTKSVAQIVAEIEASQLNKNDLYLEWLPEDLVTAYAPTNRFYTKFYPRPWHGVRPEDLRVDFKLYDELMAAREALLKKPGAWIESLRKTHLGMWVHETGYWLIYKNGFRDYAKGTHLEKVDMQRIYYVQFSALKELLETGQWEKQVAHFTPAAVPYK